MLDDVQLSDPQVVQRSAWPYAGPPPRASSWSPALQADLDWLRGGRRPATVVTGSEPEPNRAPAKPVPTA